MKESKQKLVTKEHILFKNDGKKPLPITMVTIIPVNEDDEEPVYMELKINPFLREELSEFNRKSLVLLKEYGGRIGSAKDAKEKAALSRELDEKERELKNIQEKHIVLERIIEPVFTEDDFILMTQKGIDAFYLTVMCASKVPGKMLLRAVGENPSDKKTKEEKSKPAEKSSDDEVK